jgi:hypothetical protein
MQHFTKRITIGQSFLNFYFNKIFTVEGIRYHVSVVGTDKKAYSFNMELKENDWVLSNPRNCPSWITDLEKEFSQTINDNISSDN